jgi:hypothetical protein
MFRRKALYRDFIVGALGDVANPMKTSAERLAGWTAAKDRMMRVGLIPPPKGMDQGTAAKSAGPASAGGGSIRDQADAILRGSN